MFRSVSLSFQSTPMTIPPGINEAFKTFSYLAEQIPSHYYSFSKNCWLFLFAYFSSWTLKITLLSSSKNVADTEIHHQDALARNGLLLSCEDCIDTFQLSHPLESHFSRGHFHWATGGDGDEKSVISAGPGWLHGATSSQMVGWDFAAFTSQFFCSQSCYFPLFFSDISP